MSKYYVYIHRRLDNNSIFYVGSGINGRYKSRGNRNKKWNDIVNSVGYTCEIVCSNLSKSDTLELESLTIEMLSLLVNTHTYNGAYDIEKYYDFLNSIFRLDSTSTTGLVYKENRYKNKGAISKQAGDVAGSIAKSSNGLPRSYMVKVTFPDGIKRELQCHRVVWLLAKKSISTELVIDHIDGNPLNNDLENLRLVSQTQNNRNRKPRSNNIPGVYVKSGAWVADIFVDGKRKQTSFSIHKYGNDTAKELAIKVRSDFLRSVDLTNEPYTLRHSKLELE